MARLIHPKVKWNGKTVALDDGHGLYTPGKRTPFIKALGREVHENEFNEAVVNYLTELLLEAGFRVLLVAETDVDTPLKARTDAANQFNADIYVSIHYNAMGSTFEYSKASGISVHIYPGQRSKAAGKLAEAIGKHLQKGTAQVYRGVKENDFHVLRETNMPAILSENGFMDDEKEALLMVNEAYQRETANEHFLGIMDYFGFEVVKKTGWEQVDGKWFYYKDGSLVKNDWVKHKNVWYFLGADGVMFDNKWVRWKNKWYYLAKGGDMATNRCVEWKGKWYCLGADGAMLEGTIELGSDGELNL